MKKSMYMNFCLQLVGIAQIEDIAERERRLNEFMSACQANPNYKLS